MRYHLSLMLTFTFAIAATITNATQAEDWLRFRGPSGSGVVTDSKKLPTTWSPNANLGWKVELPGPGASSPIIVGEKAMITCYSGYGVDRETPGEIENLVRHLVCVDMKTGKKLWQKDIKAAQPEDPYSGIGVTAHGYSSHTPVSDGTNVYAFLGKSGVHAFDLDGKELWQADVGKESDLTKWGSSSSPILYKDIVIVTAAYESQSIVGLDKKTGEELWRQEAAGLDGMWGTPMLVNVDDNRTDLVMCVAKEMWGLNPATGSMLWFANATDARHAYTSVVADEKRVFAFTSRGGGSIAVEAGGSGDVSETHTKWTGGDTSSFASPIRHNSKLYVIKSGIMNVVDADTGKSVTKVRLKGVKKSASRFGSLDYPSPIVVNDQMFYMTGSGQMFVFELGDEPKQVAVNQVTNEKETFWGTPAVSDGNMVLRSQKYLYCVTDKGEEVSEEDMQSAKAAPPAEGEEAEPAPQRRQRFDPAATFDRMDADSDGKLVEDEYSSSPMGERLKTLDKDESGDISKEEFTTGITSLFRGGGGRGGGGGGAGRQRPVDTRPDRPQRPKMAEEG